LWRGYYSIYEIRTSGCRAVTASYSDVMKFALAFSCAALLAACEDATVPPRTQPSLRPADTADGATGPDPRRTEHPGKRAAADPADAAPTDARAAVQTDSAPACATTFAGTALTGTFGRIDGHLEAIVPTSGPHACRADADHVHLQIAMNNVVYDVAVN